MVTKKEQILFDFLAQVFRGNPDPKRRAMLKKCSEQIERILAASIRAEKRKQISSQEETGSERDGAVLATQVRRKNQNQTGVTHNDIR
jgi:hypothetical protein